MTKNISSDHIIKYAKVSQVNSAQQTMTPTFRDIGVFKDLLMGDSANTPESGAEQPSPLNT